MKEKDNGITLIALVITIIVLLILAGVAIATLTGNDSIIGNVENAVGQYNNKVEEEKGVLNTIEQYLQNYVGGEKLPDITTATSIQSETTEYQDSLGNKIVVPGGFKVRVDLATKVEEGIVIEDSDGNQFVWVPVSNDNGDGSNKIKTTKGEVEISLGRYDFSGSHDTPQQYACDVSSEIWIGPCCQYVEQNLIEWVSSSVSNGGYYIARYEASYGGTEMTVVDDNGYDVTVPMPQFKQSTAAFEIGGLDPVNSDSGVLWTGADYYEAIYACRGVYVGNEYNESDFVDCDLVNSYSWDTAIVFIEKCSGNSNYANKSDGNGTLYNTGTDEGKTTDIVCNIYDMAGNLVESCTEEAWFYDTRRSL